MAHMLEVTADGTASFAYDASKNQHPWHALGAQIDGLGTIDVMLAAARANYHITTCPLMMMTPTGMVEIADRRATYRPHPLAGAPVLDKDGNPVLDKDGRTPKVHPAEQFLGVVGEDYQISSHEQIMGLAYGIVEASNDAALVDTAGVLENGKRFIAYVKLPQVLVVDPGGIADRLEGGLGIHTRHDGRGATSFFYTVIRPVCNNTVTAGENAADAVYRLPHSVDLGNHDEIVGQGRIVLGLADRWSAEYVQTAERLLAVPVTKGLFEKVVTTIWPKEDGLTGRQEKLRRNFELTMERLWDAPTNAGGFGNNGYAAVQAIGEYMDHHRRSGKGGQESRARSALGLDWQQGGNQRVKTLATSVVLDLVGGRV